MGLKDYNGKKNMQVQKKSESKHFNYLSRQCHYLKTETEYYKAVERGEKKFELRKNDRDFKKYDMICLEETVKGVKTGKKLNSVEIQFVLKDCLKYGLCDGYCILNW